MTKKKKRKRKCQSLVVRTMPNNVKEQFNHHIERTLCSLASMNLTGSRRGRT